VSRPRRRKDPLLASEAARKAAAAVLHVVAGLKTPTQASQAMGVSINRYYQLEDRALQGMMRALEPLPRGRRTSPGAEAERLTREKARLEREVTRYRALLRASQKALGLAPAPSKEGDSRRGGTKARRPRVRAQALIARLEALPPTSEPTKEAATS
jgi:hypothetical protein